MILWWIVIPFVGAIFSAFLAKRFVWQVFAILQVIVGAFMAYFYFLRAPLEVTHALHTLSFSVPWWGFPSASGWVTRYHIQLFWGADGTALWLASVSSLIGLILSFWPGWHFNQPRLQIPALLLVQGFALWGFFAYDLITFFVGFEAVLLPMYYLLLTTGREGEEGRRVALEFLLYTFLGSVPMLGGIVYGAAEISHVYGVPFTTNYLDWLKYPLSPMTQQWVYGGFILAFWVKLGLFPLHGWVLSLYRYAPLPVIVLSSALLTKLGGIGWLRMVAVFPQAHFMLAPYVGGMAAVSLMGAGLGAYFQKTLRNWLSYGTISHLSFIAIGIAATSPASISGAAWYMINHAVIAAAHLLLIASILERVESDEIEKIRGLARSMPQLTTLWMIVALASVGLPGLSQFPAEFLIITGTYVSYAVRRIVFLAAIGGVVLSALYTLPILRKVLFGTSSLKPDDLNRGEAIPLWILGSWIVITGFVAAPFLSEIQRTTTPLVQAILYQVLGVR
ncbi:MAG: NADH-quinone oxidoreductase subunit M [Bacteroidia bacterium]|nr:NADH-quinone oxidoreductase subunit M [Bacteroidia bacterium]MDW8134041.1 NADH-quinone oxidoreductase subunit M [Bacteroidia bacterium]